MKNNIPRFFLGLTVAYLILCVLLILLLSPSVLLIAFWMVILAIYGASVFTVLRKRELAHRQLLEKNSAEISRLAEDAAGKDRYLRNIIGTIPVPLAVTDSHGDIVYSSVSFTELFPRIKSTSDLLSELRQPELNAAIDRLLKASAAFDIELTMDSKSYRISGAPVGDAQSGLVLICFYDTTEISSARQMKVDFAANVSHELKTPLTVVKGFVETIRDETGPGHEAMFEIISRNIARLENLVADILILSQLESEKEIERTTVDLGDISATAVKLFEKELANRGITVKTELAPACEITGDSFLLTQAVTNLLSNAIKFNKDNGFIEIIVNSSAQTVCFEIRDSGIGIPPDHIDRIFQRFHVVDRSRSRALGGTGLGLSIVKHIVELHNGRISVESNQGEGTAFSMIFPAAHR